MANPVEFTFEIATLPSTFEGTLADFVALLPSLVTVRPDQEWTSFTVGTTMPTSNVGPWLKVTATGGEWWVWSTTSSIYVPLTVSLPAIPDGSISGSVLVDGSVTEAKLASGYVSRVDNAISAVQTAIGSGIGRLAVASKNAAQSYTFQLESATPVQTKVTFGSELVDTAGRYDPTTSRYTADVEGWYWVAVTLRTDTTSDDSPTAITASLQLWVSGQPEVIVETVTGDNDILGRVHTAVGVVHLDAGQYVEAYFGGSIASGSLVVQLSADDKKSRFQAWKLS